ncbi:MAG: shikimate dehydrogenase [Acidobacteria bacterium]|nr:shikimate dehydrogenase [Acidobacteriota bacterium]MYA45302.1 shikimate dehydrogenase [Acidobacteriota bacterium]MYI38527.1 shikimate dehydrogenase [Acidobacteriota bacterium]
MAEAAVPAAPSGGGAGFPNVVLVGSRASGKSRASRKLAEAVGWTRISTDELLEARLGPIPAFVERSGWERFREEERRVLADVTGERLIVDCGGGVVENPGSISRLRQLGTVYWIRAPAAVLRERLSRPKHRDSRPTLTGIAPAEEAALMLERRTPLYREAAESDVWTTASDGTAEEEAFETLLRAHFGPRLALTVAGAAVADLRAGLDRAIAESGPLDLIEVRLDILERPAPADLRVVLGDLPGPLLARLIATVRRRDEGGSFSGSEDDRVGLLAEAARLGAGYCDLEFEADRESGGAHARRIRSAAPAVRLVASVHDLNGVPAGFETLPDRMAPMRPALTKVAVRTAGRADVERVHSLIRAQASRETPIVGIAMGDAGTALRVTAGSAGAALSTYAPPEGLPAVAPGQLTAGAIRSRHCRWGRRLHALVPVYGVVGSPIGQSLSPPMHEAAFRRLGIEAAYLPFAVPPAELEDFLMAARLGGVGGLNVTIPHKQAVLPHLDSLDDDARRIGAVNTIIPMNGGLGGANTDWAGAVRALEEAVALPGRRATVLGAGGSARAVLHGLAHSGAEAVVISRNDRKAATLADEMGVAHAPAAALERIEGDILINTTPVGMAPDHDGCPAPAAAIAAHEIVFDLVFHPERTPLLRKAAGIGKRTVPGLRMLILQAAAAFERWTGRPAPVQVMADAARKARDAR